MEQALALALAADFEGRGVTTAGNADGIGHEPSLRRVAVCQRRARPYWRS